MTNRPPIPAEVEHAVRLEAGYRCAMPRCRTRRTQIAHIVGRAESLDDRFENLIALCPDCHDQYDNVKSIPLKVMKQLKANLGALNSRYGEFERRVLDNFAYQRAADREAVEATFGQFGDLDDDALRAAYVERSRRNATEWTEETEAEINGWFDVTLMRRDRKPDPVVLPAGMEVLIMYLLRDGYLIRVHESWPKGLSIAGIPLAYTYMLTPEGEAFIDAWIASDSVDWTGDY